jgi:hypothetical protein
MGFCGGGWLLNVYQHKDSIDPTVLSSVDSFANPFCYVDSSEARVLAEGELKAYGEDGMTVEECVEAGASFRYVGLEYYG